MRSRKLYRLLLYYFAWTASFSTINNTRLWRIVKVCQEPQFELVANADLAVAYNAEFAPAAGIAEAMLFPPRQSDHRERISEKKKQTKVSKQNECWILCNKHVF